MIYIISYIYDMINYNHYLFTFNYLLSITNRKMYNVIKLKTIKIN